MSMLANDNQTNLMLNVLSIALYDVLSLVLVIVRDGELAFDWCSSNVPR
jgi:hypothetical protein